jgi:hypothetical protein
VENSIQDLSLETKIDKWWHREYKDKDGLPNGYIDRRHEYLYQIFTPFPDERRQKVVKIMKENMIGNWPSDVIAISIDILYDLIRGEF